MTEEQTLVKKTTETIENWATKLYCAGISDDMRGQLLLQIEDNLKKFAKELRRLDNAKQT